MGVSLSQSRKFKNKYRRTELIRIVRTYGVSIAMEIYDIKSRKAFIKLLADNGLQPDEPPLPKLLTAMTGGEKHLFLKEHRDTIIDCLELFGRDFTMNVFNIEANTLDSIISQDPGIRYKKTINSDKPILETDTAIKFLENLEKRIEKIERLLSLHDTRIERAEEGNKATTIEYRHLEGQYGKFVENVSGTVGTHISNVFKAFIAFYLQSEVPIDKSLDVMEQVDPLSLDNLLPTKHKKKQR